MIKKFKKIGKTLIECNNANIRQRGAPVNVCNTNVNIGVSNVNPNIVGNMLPQHMPITYYTHSTPPQSSYFNEVLHPMQVIFHCHYKNR